MKALRNLVKWPDGTWRCGRGDVESFSIIYEACRDDNYPGPGNGQSRWEAFWTTFDLVVKKGWPRRYRPSK